MGLWQGNLADPLAVSGVYKMARVLAQMARGMVQWRYLAIKELHVLQRPEDLTACTFSTASLIDDLWRELNLAHLKFL